MQVPKQPSSAAGINISSGMSRSCRCIASALGATISSAKRSKVARIISLSLSSTEGNLRSSCAQSFSPSAASALLEPNSESRESSAGSAKELLNSTRLSPHSSAIGSNLVCAALSVVAHCASATCASSSSPFFAWAINALVAASSATTKANS